VENFCRNSNIYRIIAELTQVPLYGRNFEEAGDQGRVENVFKANVINPNKLV